MEVLAIKPTLQELEFLTDYYSNILVSDKKQEKLNWLTQYLFSNKNNLQLRAYKKEWKFYTKMLHAIKVSGMPLTSREIAEVIVSFEPQLDILETLSRCSTYLSSKNYKPMFRICSLMGNATTYSIK